MDKILYNQFVTNKNVKQIAQFLRNLEGQILIAGPGIDIENGGIYDGVMYLYHSPLIDSTRSKSSYLCSYHYDKMNRLYLLRPIPPVQTIYGLEVGYNYEFCIRYQVFNHRSPLRDFDEVVIYIPHDGGSIKLALLEGLKHIKRIMSREARRAICYDEEVGNMVRYAYSDLQTRSEVQKHIDFCLNSDDKYAVINI